MAMELRNAASISVEALLLSMHMAYFITEASHGSVILLASAPAKPNSSWDIRKSSLKTTVPRNASGTSNHVPSAVYITQLPLPATNEHDVPHDPSVSSADVDDNQANYTVQHQGPSMHVLQKLQTTNLLVDSDNRHCTASIVARLQHRAQQRVLDLSRGISPDQS